jgi:predicted amidohydrolase
MRHLFEPTESVYVRFSIKFSRGWGWSGRAYHPHLMHFMTTENDRYHGPAASHLTLYIEPQNGRLRLAAQDIQNKDAPHGLTQGPLRGGYNGTFYDSKDAPFNDDAWHTIEAFFQLNSLDRKQDRPNADGIARAWVDGKLAIERTDLVFRSTDFPNMKFNQYLLAPYFGPGLLPHEQTLWIDELVVAKNRPDSAEGEPSKSAPARRTMRVAAVQTKNRTLDYQAKAPEILASVERSLVELAQLVDRAGEQRCDALAFPEDTLGLLRWEAANPNALDTVLPKAVNRMVEQLGAAAAKNRLYLVVCSDVMERDGHVYNTSILIGRDGKEVGRYHKVNLPFGEQSRTRGNDFPVFPTPDLGTVGMLICYDMVFPEATRCLAVQGADIVFNPTLGGAAFGDGDINEAAFRTRAADNFLYLVVAKRGGGSMIISPGGKILATAKGADALAVAEIDPFGGREAGDAYNTQKDMRGRLFRERVPEAYKILTNPSPPVLAKVPTNVSKDDVIRIQATLLTDGEARLRAADALAREGKTEEAIKRYEQLCQECPTSWIDRVARERAEKLRGSDKKPVPKDE